MKHPLITALDYEFGQLQAVLHWQFDARTGSPEPAIESRMHSETSCEHMYDILGRAH